MNLFVNYTSGSDPTNKPLQRQNVGNVQFSSDWRVGAEGTRLEGISGNMGGCGGSLD